jgi:pSer/pThr/pTyr-binding forkhead associated (FHA) protein
MSVFEEIEKTIERGFRKWTERLFGAAQSDELLLVHRAILEDIESKVQFAARGRRLFPYSHLKVTLHSPDADRRALYQAAFGEQLERDVREMLDAARCEMPRRFAMEVTTGEGAERPFEIAYDTAPVTSTPAVTAEAPAVEATGPGRLVIVRGKAEQAEYTLSKTRTNIGRLAELTDSEQRVLRRNDIVFEEGGDDANATVSRRHAHIKREGGEYRICDDESEYGTRVFRDGRPIEVPAGNRRGEKLRPGDEIYVGRACLRFEA